MGIGLLDEAEKAFKEGQALPQVVEHWRFGHIYGLGLLALERDQPVEAIGYLKTVVSLEDYDALAHAHADLGIAYLSMGEPRQARQHSLEAAAIVEAGIYSLEYPLQNIWWRRYQVLAATGTEGAFEALGRAQATMLIVIETLSDEGLRRNYLNKVAINRDITLTWTAEAARRGLSTAPFTEHQPAPGNLQDQFRRVVAIGGRLSAQHDPTTLADFIIDEFVELGGAERVLLLLLNEDGDSFPAASFNAGTSLDLAQPLLERVRHERQSLLRQDVGDVPEGAVPQLHQRSLIALPLIAQGRLLGLLYGDMRQIFGRFDEADLNLLSMLANQAAAALENAELVSTLEDKVEERTVELKSANESLAERNNELSIINGVQQALAAELDLQSIFNIVGDTLSEIYGTDSIALWTYD